MTEAFFKINTKGRIIGKHVYGNLYNCPREILSNEEKLKQILIEAAKIANMTLWDIRSWKFGGDKGGVSVIALLVESHIAIHTWVEYNYATVDVYTCGENSDPWKAFYYIISEVKVEDFTVHYSDRSSRIISR